MVRLVLLAAALGIAGCGSTAGTGAPAATTPQPRPLVRVVSLDPGSRSAIIAGPIHVTSINPGSDLELAIVSGDTCGGNEIWFAYSGSGVSVPSGQVLCAKSRAGETRAHAFSGH